VDHSQITSPGSSSQPSQHQHKASQDSSKSGKTGVVKEPVPYMSIDEALEWKAKRKSNINAPLPYAYLLDRLMNPKRDQVCSHRVFHI
jgi:hypothetical protein